MSKWFSRKDFNYVYSKWFHHIGTMRVVRKKTNGELRLIICHGFGTDDVHSLTDSHALDVFIWLGRYLAQKGKLPRHLALDETAVKAQRVSKDIRSIIANEHYQLVKGKGP